MTRKTLRKVTGKLGLAALFLGTSVLAQPAPAPETQPPAGGPDTEIRSRRSQLTGPEQIAQGQQYIMKMKQVLARVEKLADTARKDKDIIKLNCVNDRLTQLKGHLNLGEKNFEQLQAAAARNNTEARNHEFSKLTITYQKAVVLGQEAEECIGEDIAFVGESRVEVEVDEEIPTEDPTQVPEPPLPIVRPPLASPFT